MVTPNHSVKVDYGDGWQVMQGEGLDYSFDLPAFSVTKSIKNQDISYTIAVFDENDEQQRYLEDFFTILANTQSEPKPEKTNVAPTIELVSGADSVLKNKSYTVQFKARDDDGNLSRIEVNWGDGSANDSKTATNNTTLSFSHTYKFAGIQNLIATAFDDLETASEDFTKSVTVSEPAATTVKVPDVSNANAAPSSIIQGNSTTFNTTLSAALPSGYTVKINYGKGLTRHSAPIKSNL